jgi:glycosyltransferase involved in cell wall biosynthesis
MNRSNNNLFIDLTNTAHMPALTGVQRVSRCLYYECNQLSSNALPITFDKFVNEWRELKNWEIQNLHCQKPSRKRSPRWPLFAKLSKYKHYFSSNKSTKISLPQNANFIVPEIFSRATASKYEVLFSYIQGRKIAVFHDAIALKHPQFMSRENVAWFPLYMNILAKFDGVAAVSQLSKSELVEWWEWCGLEKTPPVEVIPLGSDLPPLSSHRQNKDINKTIPTILSVATIEVRKNHIVLLEACEILWREGVDFSLKLAGSVQRHTGKPTLDKILQLQKNGRPLFLHEACEESLLTQLYDECSFTVFPSIAEGFGLPVIESLRHNRPCVFWKHGALAEHKNLGGAVALDTMDAVSLANTLRELLLDNNLLSTTMQKIQQSQLRSWQNYAIDLLEWLKTI